MLLWTLACAPEPVDTGNAAAWCSVDADNALRVRCGRRDVGSATILKLDAGGVSRSFVWPSGAAEVVAWGLTEATPWAWSAQGVTGSVVTGSAPAGIAPAAVVTGAPDVDALLFESCGSPGTLVMVDGAGRLVWYEDLSAVAPGVANVAYAWTEQGTVVAVMGRARLLEVAVDGSILADWDLAAAGLSGLAHHDVARAGGRTYVLYAFEDDALIVDGVAVLDDAGRLVGDLDTRRWFDADQVVPQDFDAYWLGVFPGARSLAHANSLYAHSDGSLLVGFRYLDAVVSVDGDPGSATFGALGWAVEGRDGPGITGARALTSSVTGDVAFEAPHAAALDASGRLLLLDNGLDGAAPSRGLVLSVATPDVAEIVEVLDLPEWCPVQGGVLARDGASTVVTCARVDEVYGFVGDALMWTIDLECVAPDSAPEPMMITRAVPVSW